jgi:hypothetical protein
MYEGTVQLRSSRLVYAGVVGAFVIVLAASLVPGFGIILAAPIASLLIGGAAAFWLGHAAHDSAAAAAGASATAGLGALLATVLAFGILSRSDFGAIAELGLSGGLFVGFAVGLINLGLATLGGILVWMAVGEAPAA